MPQTYLHPTILKFLEDRIKQKQIHSDTGIAISVVDKNEVIYQDTFGLRDHAQKAPVTKHTLFSVCSLTKAFSVLPFLERHESKQWDIEASLTRSFPPIRFKDKQLQDNVSTIDLMSHRSGLPSNDLLWILFSDTPKTAVNSFVSFSAVDTFRKSFNYCNLDYTYLDLVFQNRFGSPLSRSVEQNVLKRLSLHETFFLTDPQNAPYEMAKPYTGPNLVPWMDTSCISAAGGLYTTIEDIGRWMQFHLNSETQSLDRIGISKSTMAKTYQPHVAVHQQNPIFFQGFEWLNDDLGYALGWFTGRWNNERILFHPGIGDGFSTSILLLPDSGIGISVFVNNTLSPLPGKLSNLILKTRFAKNVDPNVDIISNLPLPQAPLPKNNIQSDHLIPGVYENSEYGNIELLYKNSQWLIKFQRHELPLTFTDHNEATVLLPAFGISLPMPISFTASSSFSIPLSMDPRVPPQIFIKKI